MSSKKSRMGKTLKTVQKEIENSGAKKSRMPRKAKEALPISPLDMSSIERASCFEDQEVLSYGNPLHSTALEDDFSPEQGQKFAPKKTGGERIGAGLSETPRRPRKIDEEGQTPGRSNAQLPSTSSAPTGRKLRAQRKSLGVKSTTRALQRVSEGPEADQTTGRRGRAWSSGELVPSRSGKESSDDSEPLPKRARRVKGQTAPALPKNKAPGHSEGSVSTPEGGPSQSSESGSRQGGSKQSAPEGQLSESSSAVAGRRRQRSSLSSEDLSEEDPSWHKDPGRKSAGPLMREKRKPAGRRQSSVPKKRKSSSGSSGDAGPSNKSKKLRERDIRNPIDLDVVLDAFQDFVCHYKETVDSGPVRQAIDAVSDMFEEQMTDVINNTKGLTRLKRENIKINGTINKKRARLIEIKNELKMKESELRSLQKEHGQLEERLTDLRKGTAFLSGLRELHQKYRAHRQRHPTEEEVYGPSSVPALLLEARGVLGAEHQLKNINEGLRQALEQAKRHPAVCHVHPSGQSPSSSQTDPPLRPIAI